MLNRRFKLQNMFCFLLLVLTLFVLFFRFYYVSSFISKRRYNRLKPAKLMIILGSGGHTAEMMSILKQLPKLNYSPRYYILSINDITSEPKISDIEESSSNDYKIFHIKRSRQVGQSYLTSIFTTIDAIWSSIPVVYNIQPDLVLCNGPGTCVPICLIVFFFKLLGVLDCHSKIAYVESLCRVRTLSLTGKIMIWFVDSFVVQWPQLSQSSPKIKYFGRLT